MSSSELIRRIRAASGLSQAELARRSGIARPVINYYENGRREPSVRALARLAEAAGLRLKAVPRQPLNLVENARILADVLDLTEQLPARRRPDQLKFPPLAEAHR